VGEGYIHTYILNSLNETLLGTSSAPLNRTHPNLPFGGDGVVPGMELGPLNGSDVDLNFTDYGSSGTGTYGGAGIEDLNSHLPPKIDQINE
jgi:hypothetical protein